MYCFSNSTKVAGGSGALHRSLMALVLRMLDGAAKAPAATSATVDRMVFASMLASLTSDLIVH